MTVLWVSSWRLSLLACLRGTLTSRFNDWVSLNLLEGPELCGLQTAPTLDAWASNP